MAYMENVLVGSVTDENGLVIEIYATEFDGGYSLSLQVAEGYADLRGFFLDGATAVSSSLEGEAAALDTSLSGDVNMKGTHLTFDSAYEIGTSGMAKDDIQQATFTFNGSLQDLDELNFGIRATSVGADREDSVKLTGVFDIPEPESEGPRDHFEEWGTGAKDGLPAISHITLYWQDASDSDGWKTIKFDYDFDDAEFSLSNDLDNDLSGLLDFLVAEGAISSSEVGELDGVAIKGGTVEQFYALDGEPEAEYSEVTSNFRGQKITSIEGELPEGLDGLIKASALDMAYSWNPETDMWMA